MRIAISQIATRAGELAQTVGRMASVSHAAAARSADLLVFPVAALTGPLPVDYAAEVPFVADVTEALGRLAREAACPCLVPLVLGGEGLPEVEVVLVRDGRIAPVGPGSLARAWRAGGARGGHEVPAPRAPLSVEVAGTRLGLALSYEDLDAWCDAPQGVDALIYLAPYGYAVDDPSSALGAALGEGRYVDDVRETGLWLAGVGSLGGYGTQVFPGSSFVLAPDGRLAASGAAFEEDLVVADLGPGVSLGPDAEVSGELYDERYHLWQALVMGIRDYVQKLGYGGVALPLDGSLASLLLASLATDALGPTNVHALLCAPAGSARVADVARLARALRIGVRAAQVPEGADAALARDLSTAQLLALAREVGALPLSAADKTGLALEADPLSARGALLAPLGDVYRIDVLDVARLRNTISPVLPPLAVLPSDVPALGMDVPAWGCEALLEQVDYVLAAHVEAERTLTEAARSVDDDALAQAVLASLRAHEAGRLGQPPCLMMTSRTLADARMPLGLAWADRLREDDAPAPRPELAEAPTPRDDGEARHPGEDRVTEREIMEALGLLRDLAEEGGAPDWHSPFSEN